MAGPKEDVVLVSDEDEDSTSRTQVGRAQIKSKADEAFEELLSVCEEHMKNDKKIIEFLKKRHSAASSSYTQMDEFCDRVAITRAKIESEPKRIYVHLIELANELKAYKRKQERPLSSKKRKAEDLNSEEEKANVKKLTLPGSAHSEIVSRGNDLKHHSALEIQTSVSEGSNQSDNLFTNKNPGAGHGAGLDSWTSGAEDSNHTSAHKDNGAATSGANKTSGPGAGERGREKKTGSGRQIHKLEKLLEDISKAIKKLQEKELDLDALDDEDSAYLQEERLQKRFVKVWNKICDLKGRAPATGRPTELKFRYEGSRYAELNKAIERFINKKHIFPDYYDVKKIIQKTNVKHHLRLGQKALLDLAKEIFTDVGNLLQERRIKDFTSNFGCHLTENYKEHEDPALYDRDLRRRLEENRKVSKSKLEEVINKFARKQYDLQEDPEEVPSEGDDEKDSNAEEEEEKGTDIEGDNALGVEEAEDSDTGTGKDTDKNDDDDSDVEEISPESHRDSGNDVDSVVEDKDIEEEESEEELGVKLAQDGAIDSDSEEVSRICTRKRPEDVNPVHVVPFVTAVRTYSPLPSSANRLCSKTNDVQSTNTDFAQNVVVHCPGHVPNKATSQLMVHQERIIASSHLEIPQESSNLQQQHVTLREKSNSQSETHNSPVDRNLGTEKCIPSDEALNSDSIFSGSFVSPTEQLSEDNANTEEPFSSLSLESYYTPPTRQLSTNEENNIDYQSYSDSQNSTLGSVDLDCAGNTGKVCEKPYAMKEVAGNVSDTRGKTDSQRSILEEKYFICTTDLDTSNDYSVITNQFSSASANSEDSSAEPNNSAPHSLEDIFAESPDINETLLTEKSPSSNDYTVITNQFSSAPADSKDSSAEPNKSAPHSLEDIFAETSDVNETFLTEKSPSSSSSATLEASPLRNVSEMCSSPAGSAVQKDEDGQKKEQKICGNSLEEVHLVDNESTVASEFVIKKPVDANFKEINNDYSEEDSIDGSQSLLTKMENLMDLTEKEMDSKNASYHSDQEEKRRDMNEETLLQDNEGEYTMDPNDRCSQSSKEQQSYLQTNQSEGISLQHKHDGEESRPKPSSSILTNVDSISKGSSTTACELDSNQEGSNQQMTKPDNTNESSIQTIAKLKSDSICDESKKEYGLWVDDLSNSSSLLLAPDHTPDSKNSHLTSSLDIEENTEDGADSQEIVLYNLNGEDIHMDAECKEGVAVASDSDKADTCFQEYVFQEDSNHCSSTTPDLDISDSVNFGCLDKPKEEVSKNDYNYTDQNHSGIENFPKEQTSEVASNKDCAQSKSGQTDQCMDKIETKAFDPDECIVELVVPEVDSARKESKISDDQSDAGANIGKCGLSNIVRENNEQTNPLPTVTDTDSLPQENIASVACESPKPAPAGANIQSQQIKHDGESTPSKPQGTVTSIPKPAEAKPKTIHLNIPKAFKLKVGKVIGNRIKDKKQMVVVPIDAKISDTDANSSNADHASINNQKDRSGNDKGFVEKDYPCTERQEPNNKDLQEKPTKAATPSSFQGTPAISGSIDTEAKLLGNVSAVPKTGSSQVTSQPSTISKPSGLVGSLQPSMERIPSVQSSSSSNQIVVTSVDASKHSKGPHSVTPVSLYRNVTSTMTLTSGSVIGHTTIPSSTPPEMASTSGIVVQNRKTNLLEAPTCTNKGVTNIVLLNSPRVQPPSTVLVNSNPQICSQQGSTVGSRQNWKTPPPSNANIQILPAPQGQGQNLGPGLANPALTYLLLQRPSSNPIMPATCSYSKASVNSTMVSQISKTPVGVRANVIRPGLPAQGLFIPPQGLRPQATPSTSYVPLQTFGAPPPPTHVLGRTSGHLHNTGQLTASTVPPKSPIIPTPPSSDILQRKNLSAVVLPPRPTLTTVRAGNLASALATSSVSEHNRKKELSDQVGKDGGSPLRIASYKSLLTNVEVKPCYVDEKVIWVAKSTTNDNDSTDESQRLMDLRVSKNQYPSIAKGLLSEKHTEKNINAPRPITPAFQAAASQSPQASIVPERVRNTTLVDNSTRVAVPQCQTKPQHTRDTSTDTVALSQSQCKAGVSSVSTETDQRIIEFVVVDKEKNKRKVKIKLASGTTNYIKEEAIKKTVMDTLSTVGIGRLLEQSPTAAADGGRQKMEVCVDNIDNAGKEVADAVSTALKKMIKHCGPKAFSVVTTVASRSESSGAGTRTWCGIGKRVVGQGTPSSQQGPRQNRTEPNSDEAVIVLSD
ncbi:uncharacterized protein LOC106157618 isoform X1 [Lingula anatina]|uniref:Death domain-associated protein 6 n=1 Tax=Lingula anatina TaxID=7574 RepID=A0A1S3HUQ4_LINAN|nr:uncharacterized protein LOC106157618 isoform X1 [Lingula anatina]|eukprot:XP_013388789.1 uncharacterized protein LOC106157618 isoform X1 [Lingula anatina]